VPLPCTAIIYRFFFFLKKKKLELFCLSGASRKAPKKLPNGQKPPNGQSKYPEKRVFDNRKYGFVVL
jgi:hypothetical protein